MSDHLDEPPADDSAASPVEHVPEATPATGRGKRGKRRHRRAVDPGRGPEPVWDGAAWEDDPRAWGEGGEDREHDSDQRILREKPPHW